VIYRFGEYELDTDLFELRKAGTPQRLEPQVFDVLAFLVENRGRLVTKDELFERVWGDKYISEAALTTRLMAARRAIGDSGREQRWIRTQHARGFRFIGAVEEEGAASPQVDLQQYDSGVLQGATFAPEPTYTSPDEARDEIEEPHQGRAEADATIEHRRGVLAGQTEPLRRRSLDSGAATQRRRLFLLGGSLLAAVALILTGYLAWPHAADKATSLGVVDCALPLVTAPDAAQTGAIMFTGSYQGRNAVYQVNFDGSGLTLAYDDPLFDTDAKWSPDGKRMVFTSRASDNRDIYVSTPGQAPLRLTHDPSDDLEPAWSPDGSLIAFTSGRDGHRDIYLMTPEGAIRSRVTSDLADDFHPAWSPDGRWLAFASTRNGNRDLYLTRTDGSCVKRLTEHSLDDDQPAWSPNGQEIAFQSRRDGNREIYTIKVDGKGLSRLTSNTSDDRRPVWSPDGSFLAFISTKDGVRQIFIIQSNGVGLRQLTDTPGDKDQPSWVLSGF
jgi:Tol biopolymer transport system component/DNA-binding winged helix-turn-helix (wHTH) protein